MKALLSFFIFLLTALLSFAQTPNIKEISIDPQLIGDLYSTVNSNKNLVIIIPGSGPTNRNGNSYMGLRSDSYKMLAQALAEKSLDVFTYDKRVISLLKANQVKQEDQRFEFGIEDLALIVDYFAPKYKNITLIGHSEGALLGSILAHTSNQVTKYVSLQGAGASADQILYEQLTKQLPALSDQITAIHQQLKQGKTVEEIPFLLKSVYIPSVQPYLISWMQYDPSVEIKKVQQPVLIIDGDKDLQVSLEQGDLLSQANPKAKRITLKNMNHVLKHLDKDEDNLKSYTDPSFPLHPELVSTIATFVLTP